MKRTKLKRKGTSPQAIIKDQIQAILRQIVIARDGGCIFRHYKNEINHQYRECGGWRKDGGLILQAEHLHTRANASSFSDTRLVICICQRHHIYYKPQHSNEYYRIVKKHIGPARTKLLEAVQQDRTAHKVDMMLELVALKQELKKYEKVDGDIEYQQV
jgi:hypothetical protein